MKCLAGKIVGTQKENRLLFMKLRVCLNQKEFYRNTSNLFWFTGALRTQNIYYLYKKVHNKKKKK